MLKRYQQLTGISLRPMLVNTLWVALDALFALVPYLLVFQLLSVLIADNQLPETWPYYCLAIAVCVLVRMVMIRIANLKQSYLATLVGEKTRNGLLSKLTNIPMGRLLSIDLGTLNNTLLKDVDHVEHAFSHVVSHLMAVLCTLSVILLGLAYFDWRLALSMAAGIPLACGAFYWLNKASLNSKAQLYQAGDELTDTIFDYIAGIKILRVHGCAGGEILSLDEKSKSARDAHLSFEKRATLAPAAFIVLAESGFALLISLGIYWVLDGQVTVSVLLLFLLLSTQFYRPIMQAGILISQWQFFQSAMDRVAGVLAEPELDNITDSASKQSSNNGSNPFSGVELTNVSFAYQQQQVLSQVSFTVKPNTVTAIVGPSGSGKSTLIHLLARFWDVQSGQILLSGQPINSLTQTQIAQLVSVVFQQVYLFDDSILNNLTMGNPSISTDEIERCCQMASCWEFIQSLPQGLDTQVGEGGTKLSGGEKQRISIARALLKQSPLILLDEATAALDAENELKVKQAVSHLVENKTVIMVAHNLSSITHVDQIVVMNSGKVESVGQHEALLSSCETYQVLWRDHQSSTSWCL